MIAPPIGLTAVLKLLAEPTRLRMLALLDHTELSVGELAKDLGMDQGRVSNHLRLLREAGLLEERHTGSSTFLRLAASPSGSNSATRLWSSLRGELESLPEHTADLTRLEVVLAARGGDHSFFDQIAGRWDKLAGAFRTGQARQRAGLHLFPRGTSIADVGCGTGYMGHAPLGHCDRLVSIDLSQGMLDEAQKRLAHSRGTELEFRRGAIDALPLADGEVDGVLAGMVLHHLPQLDPALSEMRRVLRPGGAACVLELSPHRETWMRDRLGDHHLGLDSTDVLAAFQRAGFEDISLEPVDDQYQPESPSGEPVSLSLFIVRGYVPRATSTSS